MENIPVYYTVVIFRKIKKNSSFEFVNIAINIFKFTLFDLTNKWCYEDTNKKNKMFLNL